MMEIESGRPVQRTVTVVLGDFSLKSLGGPSLRKPGNLAGQLMQVIRYYLADKDSGRVEWPYPRLPLKVAEGKGVEAQVDIDGTIWEEFANEADRQSVATEQLLQHAVFYFAADLDAGRLTQRILDDLS
jgi:hypothetical protein